MKILVELIVLFITALSGNEIAAQKQPAGFSARQDLYRMKLIDHSLLQITISVHPDQKSEKLPVDVHLFPKDVQNEKGPDLWVIRDATDIDFAPGQDRYYALAKETESTIFVFFLWNECYLNIDKRAGKVLQKGTGDQALQAYESLVPLKLKVWAPSTTKKVLNPFEPR